MAPTIDKNGVDVKSGNIVYKRRELSIGPVGNMGLQLDRIYSGGALRDTFSNLLSEQYDYVLGSSYGAIPFFGEYTDSFSGIFSQNGGMLDNQKYTTSDGIEINFTELVVEQVLEPMYSSFRMASSVSYPNGVIWNIHYKEVQSPVLNYLRIQSVTSNTGYQIKFYYESDVMSSDYSNASSWQRRVKAVAINNAFEYCNPIADSCSLSLSWPEVNYTYSSGFSSVAHEGETRYTGYSSPNLGYRIKEPGYSSDNILYSLVSIENPCDMSICMTGSQFRVSSATVKGVTTAYTYTKNDSLKHWIVTSSGPLSDNNTYVSRYPYPGIIKWTDPLSRVYNFEYNLGNGQLTKAIFPEGNYSTYDRKTSGAILNQTSYPKAGSGLTAISESRSYPPDCPSMSNKNMRICNQPLTITDPKGNVTSYTYSPVHGGVLTETRPAVNGIQPVIRFAYAQRYAWIKNSSGSYVQAPTPIWLKTEQRTCVATATVGNACAGGASDEVVTSYEYGSNAGPNNLLLKAIVTTADGVTTRNCFGYDIYGNKVSETGARAGLTVCP